MLMLLAWEAFDIKRGKESGLGETTDGNEKEGWGD